MVTRDKELVEAIQSRRKFLHTRVTLAVILAGCFFPNTGVAFAATWLATYLAAQLTEWFWLSPERTGHMLETGVDRRTMILIVGLVTISNLIFGLFGVREAFSGTAAGLACATLLLAGASFNAILTSHQCRPLLLAGLIPAAAFNMAVPIAIWIGGQSGVHVMLLIGGVLLYYAVILQALKLVNHLFAAERAARQTAEAAEKARARMVANVSHELRTPLNAVIASASLLKLSRLNDREAEAVGHLASGAATLQALISDILDASKVEAGKMDLLDEPFDVVATVRAGVDLFRASSASKHLPLQLVTNHDEVWVRGDALRLSQILANLCSNSIKFTSQGEVVITLHASTDDTLTSVELSVSDTGIGMDAATAAKMFQPFTQADASTTRQYGGTGLGLSISKALAEAMGGSLSVQSESGAGSTFLLVLNLATAQPMEQPRERSIPQNLVTLSRRPQVLVADDNLANRRLICLILADFCDVVAVEDGVQALSEISERPFDLFITDLQMPVMDGPAVLAELRRREQGGQDRLRSILATADAQISRAAAESLGADGVLTKPFTAEELFSAVNAQLSMSMDRGEGDADADMYGLKAL